MTEQTAPRVAPASAPQLTEHVNVLMTEDSRAFILGSKIADEARSEAAVARALIDDSIAVWAEEQPTEYKRRVALGRAEMARRAA